jgi:hypothetical protein
VSPPKGRLYNKEVASWFSELIENKVASEEGENTEKPNVKNIDTEFMNQLFIASAIDLKDMLELNRDIRDVLGLLSYRFTKEEVLDLSWVLVPSM